MSKKSPIFLANLFVILFSIFLITSNFTVKAASFQIMSWMFQDEVGNRVNITYSNGRYYVKEQLLKIQYYGYYIVDSVAGALIDQSCNLKVNGTDVSIPAVSGEYDTYNGQDAVKIVCDFSDVFTLEKGRNVLNPGGAYVVQGPSGVIPFPPQYDTLYIYYDIDGPIVTLEVVDKPARNECTLSELNQKAEDCKVKIAYSVRDEHGRVKSAQLTYTVPTALSKTYTIPSSQFDGNTYYLVVDLKDMGITRAGTYYFNPTIEAEDEAGNSNGAIQSVEIRVNPDPTPTATQTETPTPTPTITETTEPTPTVTTETTKAQSQETQTEQQTEDRTSQDTFKNYRLIAGALSLLALLMGIGVGYYIWRKKMVVVESKE